MMSSRFGPPDLSRSVPGLRPSMVALKLHLYTVTVTDYAASLTARLLDVEAKIEALAEADSASQPPQMILPARYPAAPRRFVTTFADADTAEATSSDTSESGSEGSSPRADALGDVDAALAGVKSSLQRLSSQAVALPRVPGRNTAELFHFFNQPAPLEAELRDEVGTNYASPTRKSPCCHTASCITHHAQDLQILAVTQIRGGLLNLWMLLLQARVQQPPADLTSAAGLLVFSSEDCRYVRWVRTLLEEASRRSLPHAVFY